MKGANTVEMSKRAAAVQLTSDNFEQDDKDCEEVRITTRIYVRSLGGLYLE